jgi:aldehyde:ferredoxin oxidoreductase
MSGYIGKVLKINLKQKSVKVEELDIKKAKQFIGGRGLGTKLIYG